MSLFILWNTWAEKMALVTFYFLHLLLFPTHLPSTSLMVHVWGCWHATPYNLEPPIFSHLPSNLPTEFKQETQIISPFRYSALIVRKVVLLFFRTITQNPLDHISSLTLKLREAKKLFQVYTVIGAVDSSPGWSHTHRDPMLLTTLLQVPGFFSHYSHGALDEQRPNHKKDETIHTIIRAYLHLNVTLGLTLYSLLNRNSWVLQVKIVI